MADASIDDEYVEEQFEDFNEEQSNVEEEVLNMKMSTVSKDLSEGSKLKDLEKFMNTENDSRGFTVNEISQSFEENSKGSNRKSDQLIKIVDEAKNSKTKLKKKRALSQ